MTVSEIKQLFTRFKGKPVDRLAYELQPGDVIHSEDVGVYSIQTTQDVFITFRAYDAPKNGDFIIYNGPDDVYHCKRDVFMQRNVYPATPGTDFIPASDSASAIEQMMDELKCEGERISQRGIIERIEQIAALCHSPGPPTVGDLRHSPPPSWSRTDSDRCPWPGTARRRHAAGIRPDHRLHEAESNQRKGSNGRPAYFPPAAGHWRRPRASVRNRRGIARHRCSATAERTLPPRSER